jgi:hypothetical protein
MANNKEKIMELAVEIAKLMQSTCNPHTSIIISCDHVEVLEGVQAVPVEIPD